MARYVIAARKAGRSSPSDPALSGTTLATVLGSLPTSASPIEIGLDPVDLLANQAFTLEVDPSEFASILKDLPADVIVEPEILHWPEVIPPKDLFPLRHAQPTLAGTGPASAFTVVVTGGGMPLPNAELELHLRGMGGASAFRARTDANGNGIFQLPLGQVPAALIVVPTGGFWPMVVRGDAIRSVVDCEALPTDGPLGWWHGSVGIDDFDVTRGEGIRVGVIDTGAGPHQNLAHATLVGSFVGGVFDPQGGSDVGAHGSHVTGTIGARPTARGDYGGIAPGCELFVARVFPDGRSGASNADIRDAILTLSETHRVDLINLSLGATEPSAIVRDAIEAAAERGTLCVCAAGNDGAAVNYPAAFSDAVAVAAVGRAGWGPAASLSGMRLPHEQTLFGHENLYAANFTSHGPEILGVGPGVGILATAPSHFGEDALHCCMDGTSMASPVLCASLAVVLSQNATYLGLPRTSNRTTAARNILRRILRDLGLPQSYQGLGIPSTPTPAV